MSVYTADGTQTATKKFDDPSYAITALDAYEQHDSTRYLAVGLNMQGIRILQVEQGANPNDEKLTEVSAVARHWYQPNLVFFQPNQVTMVKLGSDDQGKLILTAGQFVKEQPALETFEALTGKSVWWRNPRPWNLPWEWPDLADFGRLGAPGAQTEQLVAVSWPTLGRVSFIDAKEKTDWATADGTAAHVVRFFTGTDGTGYVAIARDTADGAGSYTISTANPRGELVTVREGAESGLPAAIAELTGA
ncbi:hypothetical protein [Agromyces aerolatus]|uniref:hypothetical protein n=1 Tax=Agromyces sp. LY-1074 TaxID=3074080 RepID=UPI0028551B4C|nr:MULTISPECIES: hypothetical protein [unclassified Agromyces]MDR5698819.1 hypothetical protein [Agromyces sp. LY-1074]MDR5705403.1 hypothetical protein [Agromyces sp. LY-1358]